MPEGLTQTKTPTFSETRPEIDRNGGRLQIGTVAGFKSENPAGINRNPQTGRNTPRVHTRQRSRTRSARILECGAAASKNPGATALAEEQADRL